MLKVPFSKIKPLFTPTPKLGGVGVHVDKMRDSRPSTESVKHASIQLLWGRELIEVMGLHGGPPPRGFETHSPNAAGEG